MNKVENIRKRQHYKNIGYSNFGEDWKFIGQSREFYKGRRAYDVKGTGEKE